MLIQPYIPGIYPIFSKHIIILHIAGIGSFFFNVASPQTLIDPIFL